jgi:hypothetical protein
MTKDFEDLRPPVPYERLGYDVALAVARACADYNCKPRDDGKLRAWDYEKEFTETFKKSWESFRTFIHEDYWHSPEA